MQVLTLPWPLFPTNLTISPSNYSIPFWDTLFKNTSFIIRSWTRTDLSRVTLHQAEHKPLLLPILHLPNTAHWGSLHPSEDPASTPFGSCGPNPLAQTSLHPTAVLLPQVLHSDSHSCRTHPAVLTAIYIKNMKQHTLLPSSVTAQVLSIAAITSHCTEV